MLRRAGRADLFLLNLALISNAAPAAPRLTNLCWLFLFVFLFIIVPLKRNDHFKLEVFKEKCRDAWDLNYGLSLIMWLRVGSLRSLRSLRNLRSLLTPASQLIN